ncbi:GNAT family N-acetyltransferase [Paramagnetospirillum kuznetsovii]|nr:GNAT family N-acetyltransferase [Paramagnetospirillum kuznetsovii]
MVSDVTAWHVLDLSFGAVENGALVAAVPLSFSPDGGCLASPWFGASGPVIAEGLHWRQQRRLLVAIMDRVRQLAAEHGARSVEFSLSPTSPRSLANRWGINPLAAFGLKDVSTQSRLIDLTLGEAALWEGLSKDSRYQVRRARAAGYTVERRPWGEMLDDYYRTHVETYQRTGASPHPKAYFDGVARLMAAQGRAELWVGLAAGKTPVAFQNIARFDGRFKYWTGCSSGEHLDSGVNYLLMWSAIASAATENGQWFEMGETFPGEVSSKNAGLTTFKSKFGGEDHRSFKGRIDFPPPAEVPTPRPDAPIYTPPQESWVMIATDFLRLGKRIVARSVGLGRALRWQRRMRRLASLLLHPFQLDGCGRPEWTSPADAEAALRRTYSAGTIYKVDDICALPIGSGISYSDRVLEAKLDAVRSSCSGDGVVVDLCCATGAHLMALSDRFRRGIGIDFSVPFIIDAERRRRQQGIQSVSFLVGSARAIPITSGSVDTVYCLSALYQIPEVEEVFVEVSRILAPGGRFVVEIGIAPSLNQMVCAAQPNLPQLHLLTLPAALAMLRRLGLSVATHRSFQLLPMWGDRPKWLKPLLSQPVVRFLMRDINGRMLEERLASLPGLKYFAFRHLIVCVKS